MDYEQEIFRFLKASKYNELWLYVDNLEKQKIKWNVNILAEGNSFLFWAVSNQGIVTNRLSRKTFIRYLLMHTDFRYVNELSYPHLQSSFLIAVRNDDTEIIELFFEYYKAGKAIDLVFSNGQLIVELLQKEIDFVKSKLMQSSCQFSELWLDGKIIIYNKLINHAKNVAKDSKNDVLLEELKRIESFSMIRSEVVQREQIYIETESLREDGSTVECSLRAKDIYREGVLSKLDETIRLSSHTFFTPPSTPGTEEDLKIDNDEGSLPIWLLRSPT